MAEGNLAQNIVIMQDASLEYGLYNGKAKERKGTERKEKERLLAAGYSS
jgi:hypothetical protein